jgi:hypothetical protein
MRMREMFFAALAAAALVAGAMPSERAQAMTVAPSAPGAAAPGARLIHHAVNVCGSNGCVKVQTQRVVKRHPPPPHH